MRIRFRIEAQTVVASLKDSATVRDFVSLLPLTLTLEDYAATEKISDLPKKLSTEGAPAGIEPQPGDITYYAPWGNLAIFHKAFRYSAGLVKIGQIEAGLDTLAQSGPVQVMVERLD
jgi:hypothetical protein